MWHTQDVNTVCWHPGEGPSKGHQHGWGLEHTLHAGRLEAQEMFSLGVRSLRRNLVAAFHTWKEITENEPGSQAPLVEAQWKDEGQQSQGHKEKKHLLWKTLITETWDQRVCVLAILSPKTWATWPALGVDPALGWRLGWTTSRGPFQPDHSLSQWLTRELA